MTQIRPTRAIRTRPRVGGVPAGPLVSCIMPTRDRADLALQAVRYFQRQDQERSELLIIDDGDDRLREGLPTDPRVRYIRARSGESIGRKRNRGCAAAAGHVIVHWDDDDWYAPSRVRRQVEPLLAGEADITALRADVFFELDPWTFWRCTPEVHRQMFVEDVHGGTLAYRRSVWSSVRFPSVSLAEDAWFLQRALRGGARLKRLDDDGLFIYLRHGRNAWRFPCGEYVDPGGWRRTGEPPLPAEDRAFYASRSSQAPDGRAPLVSCIMPTADRPALVERAIRYFLRQDYEARELIVLDDGSQRVVHLMPGDARIRYVPLDRPLVLGAKRNQCCEIARGQIIVHWDDDDWMAPHRLTYQVRELERRGADICGAGRELYLDAMRGEAWLFQHPPRRPPWVAGNTLCYTRDAWRSRPFPEIAVGEDTRFIWGGAARHILPLADNRFIVGLLHPANTSPKTTWDAWWRQVPLRTIEKVLGEDAPTYLAWRQT